jgi:2-oxoisovalerate dehydrogenase E1 component alpha subunit
MTAIHAPAAHVTPGPGATGLSPGESTPGTAAAAAAEDAGVLAQWYRTMTLARAVDELMWLVGAQGKAHFILTSRGHEAAQVASAAALRPGHDYVFTYYRSMAAALQLGVTPEQIFLSVLAKRDDPFAGGRQLPNHFSIPALRLVTVSSSVATHLPHAAGAGWAARVRGDDFVAVAYFGDGATAKGEFHEALTFAGVWKLPVIFFCENNGLAISVPVALESPAPIYRKAEGYGMPGVRVDGGDPWAVYQATRAAVERARRGEGPTLIEAEVVRLVAHSNADDQSAYRSPEDLAAAQARDPLPRLRARLLAAGLPENDLAGWERTARRQAEAALAAAEAAPDPADADARRHLYAGE